MNNEIYRSGGKHVKRRNLGYSYNSTWSENIEDKDDV